MKNRFESSEIFTAYATVEAGYYMIQKICERLGEKKLPIERLVDEATGADKELCREIRQQMFNILHQIISAKKVIEVDYSADAELLYKLKLKNYESI